VIIPDVNVLVHAFRSDSSDHALCSSWLTRVVNGESRYGISLQALSGFIRIVTHSRIFARPSPISEAVAFCEFLISQPHCVPIQPGARHWAIFTRLCEESDARGNLVADAWFAALTIESGCDWVTLDRDYARFGGLRWSLPS
jgi:toxin-antitoxin system PIN domain toxin